MAWQIVGYDFRPLLAYCDVLQQVPATFPPVIWE